MDTSTEKECFYCKAFFNLVDPEYHCNKCGTVMCEDCAEVVKETCGLMYTRTKELSRCTQCQT